MPEEVGSRTDGTSIAYCIIGIMTVLIAVTVRICLSRNGSFFALGMHSCQPVHTLKCAIHTKTKKNNHVC